MGRQLTRSRKRMLWLAVIYAHTGLIQIFFRHALIKYEDSFSSVPCPVLSAGSIQRAGCRHGTFLAPSFLGHMHPTATSTQNLLPGEAGASKGWETWEHGIWGRRTRSSIPPEQTDGAVSDGTQQTLQEHPPGLLQSQQSLLNIRHPQKTSLETKPNRFAPVLPKLWGVPQER